ncbi:MAG: di-heme oxidoredictase family protein [Planctomycetota bacterium]
MQKNKTLRRWMPRSALLVVVTALIVGANGVLAETITDTTPIPAQGEPGCPTPGLSTSEIDTWTRGRRVFDRDWKPELGLGRPDMNADSCRACHQQPVIGGGGGLDLNVMRFAFDNAGMGPFQDLPGGQISSRLRNPRVNGREEHHVNADVFEARQSPSILGLGLIESISEATILANEDPNDTDTNGIRGVARMVTIGATMIQEVGRFGWKAQVPNLEDFLRDAMGEEVGISTTDNGRGFGLFSDADSVADPEITANDFDDALFYIRNLAPPERAGSTSAAVALGETLFATAQCATCHIPELPGANGPVPLYSNLLLHNVHGPTFRGMAEPGADVGFYRTPPLWGIRLTPPYMHDGSAETLEEAILAHFGEAVTSRAAYQSMSANDKAALLAFLNDL